MKQFPDAFLIETKGTEKLCRVVGAAARGENDGDEAADPRIIRPTVVKLETAGQKMLRMARPDPPPPMPGVFAGDGVAVEPAAAAAAAAGPTQTSPPAFEVPAGFTAVDPTDPGAPLVLRLYKLLTPQRYSSINELHGAIFRGVGTVKYSDMEAFVRSRPQHFWVAKAYVAPKMEGEKLPPSVPVGAPSPLPTSAAASSVTVSTSVGGVKESKECGGWGSVYNMPTSEDVYEVLKFIPIHWMNMGNLNIPAEVKRRNMRLRSTLLWFEKQPRYFEVRNVGGTIEIRRSVLLHPEAHGLTKEEAEATVAAAEASRSGAAAPSSSGGRSSAPGPIQQQRPPPSAPTQQVASEADCTVSGTQQAAPPVPAAAAGAGAGDTAAATDSAMNPLSAAMEHVKKFLIRVCPAYFVPLELLTVRGTKRSINKENIMEAVQLNAQWFEHVTVTDAAGTPSSLIRRRTGVESTHWGESFFADVKQHPEDIAPLVALMARSCSLWDRTHYLYVRLTDDEKIAVNGFEGMVELMRRHPAVFKMGEYFFRRADQSDPNWEADEEPTAADAAVSLKVTEENPYHSPRELAVVFQYLIPDDQATTLAHFVESCSPAMKAVLPPRLVTLVLSYPDLFSCKEISPGQFAIRRAVPVTAAGGSSTATDDGTEDPEMPVGELLEGVTALVPARGVDLSQLNLWLSMPQRRAVKTHFGTLQELIAAHANRFHTVTNPPYKTIFLKK